MFFEYDHSLIEKARELRKNMTPEERKLWYNFLCKYPVRFLNQRVIDGYILDFYCSKAKLCVETDGYHHESLANREHDAIRTGVLNRHGITVIRFANEEIKYCFEEVCEKIDHKVKELLIKKQSSSNSNPS